MSKHLLRRPFIFLVLPALTGVWMRLFFFSATFHLLPYDHILHSHSHVALLGWTFFAVFIIYLFLNWGEIKQKRQAVFLCTTAFIVTLLMFIAFVYEGYALYSIIFSTIHI